MVYYLRGLSLIHISVVTERPEINVDMRAEKRRLQAVFPNKARNAAKHRFGALVNLPLCARHGGITAQIIAIDRLARHPPAPRGIKRIQIEQHVLADLHARRHAKPLFANHRRPVKLGAHGIERAVRPDEAFQNRLPIPCLLYTSSLPWSYSFLNTTIHNPFIIHACAGSFARLCSICSRPTVGLFCNQVFNSPHRANRQVCDALCRPFRRARAAEQLHHPFAFKAM